VQTRAFPVASVAAYATIVLIWGTTWLAIKVSLTGFPPVFGAGVRFVVASLLLYAIGVALRVDFRRDAPPLHLVAVLALTMCGLNYALTYTAETHLASGLVAVLFGTMPFFVFGFAHVMVGERASVATVVGAALALGGVATISLAGSVNGDVVYVVAAVTASALSAFGNVYLKRHSHAEPLATLPPAMLAGGLAMTAWGGAFERIDWHAATQTPSLLAVAYLAAGGSALAFYLNHWLLKRIDSGIIGLSALMVPVIAVVVGAFFAHERLGPRDLAGAAMVIGGVWLALGRKGAPHVKRSTESHSPA
jgi:drug/metabolite transporter (DMT)-like permease